MTLLWIALGAAVGAPARYLVDLGLRARLGERFPWGIMAGNLIGSFILGLLAGLTVGGTWNALLGIGFCGALTTYSTFGYDTIRLLERGRDGERGETTRAVLNVIGSVVLGVTLAVAGVALGRSF